MFERRLRFLLLLATAFATVIVFRLAQLQIIRAGEYRSLAQDALLTEPVSLPFRRGAILDRNGRVLVADAPCWEIAVDYRVFTASLQGDHKVLLREAKRWRGRPGWPGNRTKNQSESRAFTRSDARNPDFGRETETQADAWLLHAFSRHLDAMWRDLEVFSSDPGEDSSASPLQRARRIYERVVSIRRAVAKRRGFDGPVAEERSHHALVTGLDASQQIQARERFAPFPWVEVRASTERSYEGDMTAFAHVLGRIGRVNPVHIARDPHADDPFARYQAGEFIGITGVEHLAEQRLRGRRGRLTRDHNGQTVGEVIDPQDGADVRLTIDAELQERLYALLAEAVARVPESTGGAIVVLDVPTREVLALVSYPGFDPASFRGKYAALRDDTVHFPLRFRAVANQYAPGSIIKPLVCLTGLAGGTISPSSREPCTGYLLPEVRDRWRCWQVHGTDVRKAHGEVNVVEALAGSCNIFMYRLGERLGVPALCSAFDMVGIGRPTGIGLREEAHGINPTPDWLLRNKGTPVVPAHARLFAIGQGELALTPVQAANLMAVYASGVVRPVKLLLEEAPGPQWLLPGSPEDWRAIRAGIYGVTNDPQGTAYPYAHFQRNGYVLCGKTGSATAHPWPVSYAVPYVGPDGREGTAIVPAGAKGPAIERFLRKHPEVAFDPASVRVHERWPAEPPKEDRYAHAWFAGYLQRLNDAGDPTWSEPPRVAFAILVEFGGSGGRTGGPIAKDVAAILVERLS